MLEVGDLRLDPAARRSGAATTRSTCPRRSSRCSRSSCGGPATCSARTQLLEHAWDIAFESRSNVVDVYVRYLREKIDRPVRASVARDRARRGYRLRADGGRADGADPRPAHPGLRGRDGRRARRGRAVRLLAGGVGPERRARHLPARTRGDDLAATATGPGSIEPAQDRLVARDESLAQVIGPGGGCSTRPPAWGAHPCSGRGAGPRAARASVRGPGRGRALRRAAAAAPRARRGTAW